MNNLLFISLCSMFCLYLYDDEKYINKVHFEIWTQLDENIPSGSIIILSVQ